MRPLLQITLVLILCVSCGSRDEGPPSAELTEEGAKRSSTSQGTRLELQTSALLELYFFVRAQAADDAEAVPGYEDAVDAARAIQRSMGSFGGWGPLDTRVVLATEPRELIEGFGEFPEPYERHGRMISIRDDAVRLATALDELMPGFMKDQWPARKADLVRKIAILEADFMPTHQEALTFMMESLGIPDPGVTVPVFLVNGTNPPGAMTYRMRSSAPVSVIDINVGGSDGLLRETVLHESCHSLDLASRDAGSAFATLRAMLEERGLSRADDAYHTIPHTLMFVQAEETTRRLYDPDHVGYGEATDLYERTGETAVVEREIWQRYLDGEMSRDEALRRIVETLDPQPEGGP